MSWEPVSWRHPNNTIRDLFGVFACDDYAPEPIAIFSSEKDANDWLGWMRSDSRPDDDRLMGGDFCVMTLRARAMGEDAEPLYAWNNLDPAPEGDPS